MYGCSLNQENLGGYVHEDFDFHVQYDKKKTIKLYKLSKNIGNFKDKCLAILYFEQGHLQGKYLDNFLSRFSE